MDTTLGLLVLIYAITRNWFGFDNNIPMLPFIERFFWWRKSIHRRRLGGGALSPRCCRSSSNYRGWQVQARRQKHASLATTRFAAPSLRQPQHEEPSTKKTKPIKVSALNQFYHIGGLNQFGIHPLQFTQIVV